MTCIIEVRPYFVTLILAIMFTFSAIFAHFSVLNPSTPEEGVFCDCWVLLLIAKRLKIVLENFHFGFRVDFRYSSFKI